MTLNSPPPSADRRTVPLSLTVGVIIIVAGAAVAGTALYYELRPSTSPSGGGGGASGTLTVAGAATSVAATYVARSAFDVPVTFTETGLPPLSTWFVTLGTLTASTSVNRSIEVPVPSGQYRWTAGTSGPYAPSTASGTVAVSSSGAAVSLTFAPLSSAVWSVTFYEVGLPAGAEWAVAVASHEGTVNLTGNQPALSTYEPNGSYSFTVGQQAGLTTNVTSGSFEVFGANVTITVGFSPGRSHDYWVTFQEIGLPGGVRWSVTMGTNSSSSTGPLLAFLAPNGTYAYTVSGLSGYEVTTGAGTVSVFDDLGRQVVVPIDPTRIVVLAPSVMDIVYRLGLRSDVIGIGCTPQIAGGILNEYTNQQVALWGLSNSTCIPDYPSLDTAGVAELSPQLVLASTITSALAVQTLTQIYGIPVVLLAPSSLPGIVTDVNLVAEIFPSAIGPAQALEATLEKALNRAQNFVTNLTVNGTSMPEVLLTYYFDGGGYYTYGSGSFGDSLISALGGINLAGSLPILYGELNGSAVYASQPQVILYGTSTTDPYIVGGQTPAVWTTAPYWGSLTGQKIAIDITIASEADPTMILAIAGLQADLYPPT